MRNRLAGSEHSSKPDASSAVVHYACLGLSALAIFYAFLAGFHTLDDFDLGWQLATGRWVIRHHRIFSTDVFSHTASGQPWTYPVLSGVFFYIAFLLGGYTLLCWIGAIASASTVVLLTRRNLVSAAMLVIAAPLIAHRTQPRAEMFTTVLFAAFLVLLWRHYRGNGAPLWLLPILMLFWVNLHLGFVAGLLLCLAYVCAELLDCLSPVSRAAAVQRLRRAWPWMAVTSIATLLNPWGPFIYSALLRQARAQNLHNLWIVEWEGIHPSWNSILQPFDFRDPQSSFWWLAVAVLAGMSIAIWRKQWSASLFLAGFLFVAFRHVRLQALFACVSAVIAGSVIQEFLTLKRELADKRKEPSPVSAGRMQQSALVIVGIALALLGILRSSDLVSNRYYMRTSQLASFGGGQSWWFPQRAADFVQLEKLPANIFNGYAVGGFLTWRLFPQYRDYIDSRALPFGADLFFRAYDLAAEAPDSAAWKVEASSRDINTIIVPLSRYQGMTLFPHLREFCRSKLWAPVYMDEVSAVFLRRSPETQPLVVRLQIDCDTKVFDPLHAADVVSGGSKIDSFNALANAGGVLYSLERYSEALTFLNQADDLFSANGNVHLLRALVLEQLGRFAEAESEFRTSLSLEPSEAAMFDLGLFYMTQQRYADAAEVFRQGAESSPRPHEMWMMLGQALLQMRQPESALSALDKAEAASPFGTAGESLGAGFHSLIATGRAKASFQMGRLPEAVTYQEEAVRLAPDDAKLWLGLADLYDAEGRTREATQARTHAVQP